MDGIIVIRIRTRAEVARSRIELMVSCGERAVRSDEHIVFDGDRAVEVGIQSDEDVAAHGVLVTQADDGAGRDAHVAAAKAQQLGAMQIVGAVIGFVAVAGELFKQFVTDVDLRHGGVLQKR